MKKFLTVLLVLAVAFSAFAQSEGEAAPAVDTPSAAASASHYPTGAAPAGKVKVVFWDSYSGDAHATLEKAAAAFNASQTTWEVEIVPGSSILTKMLTSTASDRPAMFNVSGNDSAQIIATREWEEPLFIGIQEYIDHDNYDMSTTIANLATNYTREGNWMSMPWGNTSTGYYFNLDVLNAHGINVDDIKSFEDIYNVCVKLKAEGVAYPIWIRGHVDWLNFGLTTEGLNYFNNDNGRQGTPTAALFDDPAVKQSVINYFTFFKKLSDEGLIVDYNANQDTARNMFGQGECAIYMGWSSGYDATYKVVDGKANFCYRPSLPFTNAAENKGQAAGGQSVFIANVKDEWVELGAWEFIKFMCTDEWNAAFATASGYLPTTTTAFNVPSYQEYINTKCPSGAVIAAEQNRTAPGLGYALLPYSSNYSSIFTAICKKLVEDAAYTPAQAAEDLQKEVTDAVEMYWLEKGVIL